MNQNPASYTFVLQTLSQTHYKFLVKDCFHDRLYINGILNHIDQSVIMDRTSVLHNLKYPLFDSFEILRERFIQNNFVKKQSEQQRLLVISIFNDVSEQQSLKLDKA